MGEETDEGKLFRVMGGGDSVITQAPHGAITWSNIATHAGSRHGKGRTYHIYVFLPQDS